jgi:hypothetical protein
MKKIKLIAAVLLMSVAVTVASQLIENQYLPTPPPGWQIIKIEDPNPYVQGLISIHMYLQNVSTRQVAVWTVLLKG